MFQLFGEFFVKGAGMLGQPGVGVQRRRHPVRDGWYQMTGWQPPLPGIIALVDTQRPFISLWWLGGFPIPAGLPEGTSRCDGLVVRRESFRLRAAPAWSGRHARDHPQRRDRRGHRQDRIRGIRLSASGKLRRRTNGGSVGLRRMLLPQEIEKPRPDAPRGSGCRRLAGLSEPWGLELSETTFGNAASGQAIIGLTPASGATEHVDTRVGKEEDADAPRRLYYVAMTRARQTLALMRLPGPNPFQDALSNALSTLFRNGPAALPAPAPELARSYRRFSLGDVFLSFAGYRRPGPPVHTAITALSPGDPLQVRAGSGRWELLDRDGVVVGQSARNFKPPPNMRGEFATVMAIARWDRERSDSQFQANLRAGSWEVVVPELVFQPDG